MEVHGKGARGEYVRRARIFEGDSELGLVEGAKGQENGGRDGV